MLTIVCVLCGHLILLFGVPLMYGLLVMRDVPIGRRLRSLVQSVCELLAFNLL